MSRWFPVLLSAACAGNANFPTTTCKDVDVSTCIQVDPTDPEQNLQEVVNSLVDDTAVILGLGTFTLDNQVTFRSANQLSLLGQGMGETTLDFGAMQVQANGVDVIADDFLIQDLTITDAKKDGLRIEESEGVTIRRVSVTWSAGPVPENGGYGIYPVRSNKVLIEESEASHASDAGIYVGQCIEAVVRNNRAFANVAGLEIENTAYADVYGNVVEDNTGGLVVFDLPGNPVIGRDVYIHDNVVRNNNRQNFAPGGTVAQIPAGTGTFAMASRRVEITGNTYENNQTVDVALLSGLIVDSDPSKWAIPEVEVVNDITGLQLDNAPGAILNFRSTEIWVHGNTHTGSGKRPDNGDSNKRPLGLLLALAYKGTPIDTVLYDAIGESQFSATDPAKNSNDHRMCVAPDVGSFASLDLANLAARAENNDIPDKSDLYRPAAPFAPFDCTSFSGGPIQTPTFLDE
jgi:parallel beta-helix repeat protein